MTQKEDLVIVLTTLGFINVMNFNYGVMQIHSERFEDTHRILYFFGILNGILALSSLWMHLYKFLPLRILVDLLLVGVMGFSVYTFQNNLLILDNQLVYGYLLTAFGILSITCYLVHTLLCSKPDMGHTITESVLLGSSFSTLIQMIGIVSYSLYHILTFETDRSRGAMDWLTVVLGIGIFASFIMHFVRYTCRPINRMGHTYLDFFNTVISLILLCAIEENESLETLSSVLVCLFFTLCLQLSLSVVELPQQHHGHGTSATASKRIEPVSGADIESRTGNVVNKTFNINDTIDEETNPHDTSLEEIDIISPDPSDNGPRMLCGLMREHVTQVVCSGISAMCEVVFLVLSTKASGIPFPYSDEWRVVVIFLYTATFLSATSFLLILLRYLDRSAIGYCSLTVIAGASTISNGMGFFIWLQAERSSETITDAAQSWSFLFSLIAFLTSAAVSVLTVRSYYQSFMIKQD